MTQRVPPHAESANLPSGRLYFMDDREDAALVSECLRGDPQAFEPLVAKYGKVLFNVSLRMVHDYEDARDVTQTAFVKAYENLASYDPQHRFFSWIYRIMINETLNLLKRRKPQEPLDPRLAGPGNPHQQLQAKEESQRVQAALMQLPVDCREVLILRHFLDLSYAEMSAILKVPAKTVKSRLYTARQRLSDLLQGSPAR